MTATWHAPITWEVDQLVTADNLNQQIRDNQEYLLSPNHERIVRDNSGNYSITNVLTFQDIDASNLSIDLETHGGPVWVHFQAMVYTINTAHIGYFDIDVDGTRVGNAYDLGLASVTNGLPTLLSLSLLLTGLAADTYTLRPQWRTNATRTAYVMSNSSEYPIIFEAIEL